MDENGDRASRRTFLKLSGAVGAAGIAGCLDETDESTPTTAPPAERMPSPTEGHTPEITAGTPTPQDAGWESTLFAAWRGNDPARSTTLQWLVVTPEEPEPSPVSLAPAGGDGEDVSIQTDVTVFGTTEPLSRAQELHVPVEAGESQGLIRFEDVVGDASGQVPPGSDVESATFAPRIGYHGEVPARIHRMLRPWDADVTWPDLRGVATDGFDATAEPVATVAELPRQERTEIDVTAAVQAWADGEPNHGLACFAEREKWNFQSAEGWNPPRLEVTVDGETYTFEDRARNENTEDGDYDGTVDTYVTRDDSGFVPMYRHRAEFTDLTPDTAYEIAIDGTDADAVVRTAPETIEESVTFAEGGDIGVRDHVPPLHQQAASWDPLFAFVGGDLAYGDGKNREKWITLLEEWNEHMRSDGRLIPMVAAIGNHEIQGGNTGSPEKAPLYYALFDTPQTDRAYWSLDVGDAVSMLVLDNHTADYRDPDGPQTQWLEDALSERADRTHLMAGYHMPAYPGHSEFDNQVRGWIRDNWVSLFQEHGLDVAFEHDDHVYKRTHVLRDDEPAGEGVSYVGDGAWGHGPREVVAPDEREYLAKTANANHVIRVELGTDGSRTFRAVDPDGQVVDEFEHAAE